jgi:negative regulator of flagellin synthesis FlgM
MNNIDSTQRASFFPQSQTAEVSKNKASKMNPSIMKRNDYGRAKELSEMGQRDAKVNISEAIRDFSRAKKAVDASPEIDNSEKVAQLKSQIQNGTYKIDYDALADKLLSSEY